MRYKSYFLLFIASTLFCHSRCQQNKNQSEDRLFIVISNDSRLDTLVHASVSLDGQEIFHDSLDYSGYVPDMRFNTSVPLDRGDHELTVVINDSTVVKSYAFLAKGSKWFEIGYSFDSLDLNKFYSDLDSFPEQKKQMIEMNRWRHQKPPNIHLIEFDNEPVFY